MSEQSIQEVIAQKLLQLSEENAWRVLIFMSNLDAGVKMETTEPERSGVHQRTTDAQPVSG